MITESSSTTSLMDRNEAIRSEVPKTLLTVTNKTAATTPNSGAVLIPHVLRKLEVLSSDDPDTSNDGTAPCSSEESTGGEQSWLLVQRDDDLANSTRPRRAMSFLSLTSLVRKRTKAQRRRSDSDVDLLDCSHRSLRKVLLSLDDVSCSSSEADEADGGELGSTSNASTKDEGGANTSVDDEPATNTVSEEEPECKELAEVAASSSEPASCRRSSDPAAVEKNHNWFLETEEDTAVPPTPPLAHRSMSAPSLSRPLRSCLKNSDDRATRSCSFVKNEGVHFGKIHIREYRRSLADNPSVTEGPPIGLGWDYVPEETLVGVDDYESLRPPRRSKDEFLIPSRIREDMLVNEWGHTMRDVREASAESRHVRRLRERATHTNMVTERMSEVLESSKRKLHRFKTRTSKEKEQEQLWVDAREWWAADEEQSA